MLVNAWFLFFGVFFPSLTQRLRFWTRCEERERGIYSLNWVNTLFFSFLFYTSIINLSDKIGIFSPVLRVLLPDYFVCGTYSLCHVEYL
ncbi:hypothetical protein GGS20DRAFT_556608 [Poronia punctata]|nr:hypothetical protein GGS20DRAFT_556608 [Poronia punctata]